MLWQLIPGHKAVAGEADDSSTYFNSALSRLVSNRGWILLLFAPHLVK